MRFLRKIKTFVSRLLGILYGTHQVTTKRLWTNLKIGLNTSQWPGSITARLRFCNKNVFFPLSSYYVLRYFRPIISMQEYPRSLKKEKTSVEIAVQKMDRLKKFVIPQHISRNHEFRDNKNSLFVTCGDISKTCGKETPKVTEAKTRKFFLSKKLPRPQGKRSSLSTRFDSYS